MKLITLARIGRDAEVRTVGQNLVTNLSLVYNYGRKGDDGKYPSQWVDAAFWGDRVEKLAPYLLKGQQILVELSDVHIEVYQTREGGEGSKLAARVDNIEFAGPAPGSDGGQRQQAPQAQRQAPAQRQQAQQQPERSPGQRSNQQPVQQRAASGFDDMDSDIPF